MMLHPALTDTIARDFARALGERLAGELVRVSLFGSRARGEASLRSDFDLMIVLRRATGAARDAVHGLATELELEHNVELSTKIVDVERFDRLRRSTEPFWCNFVRDERILWPWTRSASG